MTCKIGFRDTAGQQQLVDQITAKLVPTIAPPTPWLTEEERQLIDYYLKDMSREFQSDAPTVRVCPSNPPPGLKTQAGA